MIDLIDLNAELDLSASAWRARICGPDFKPSLEHTRASMTLPDYPVVFTVQCIGISATAMAMMLTVPVQKERATRLLGKALAAFVAADFQAPTTWQSE